MVECQLPKLNTRVRFPSPALNDKSRLKAAFFIAVDGLCKLYPEEWTPK